MRYQYSNEADSGVNLGITDIAWATMAAYVRLCKTEISGFGRVEVVNRIPTITDIVVLPQKCTSAETEIDEAALMDWFSEHPGENWSFHWHSHPGQGIGPSRTDDDMYAGLRASFGVLRAMILSCDASQYSLFTMTDSPFPVTVSHSLTHFAGVEFDGEPATMDFGARLLGAEVDEAQASANIKKLVITPAPKAPPAQSLALPQPGKKTKGKHKRVTEMETAEEWDRYMRQFDDDSTMIGGYRL